MPTRIDLLFEKLQSREAIEALVNTAEDTDLECKEWAGDDASKRRMIAKAVCGFANGDGGVVLLGMKAKSRGEEPDLITATAFFASPEAVKAKVLSIVQAEIEPLVQGIRAAALILNDQGEGVVLILVPSSDGLPHRSKQDWKFHLRSGSSTQNMPLAVLADRFGRRPHAELRVELRPPRIEPQAGVGIKFGRLIEIHVENLGRGIARFPSLLLLKDGDFEPHVQAYVSQQDYLWPLSRAGSTWYSFRGSIDDVVYPGESLRICNVVQKESRRTFPEVSAEFSFAVLKLAVMCEGFPLTPFTFQYDSVSHPLP